MFIILCNVPVLNILLMLKKLYIEKIISCSKEKIKKKPIIKRKNYRYIPRIKIFTASFFLKINGENIILM